MEAFSLLKYWKGGGGSFTRDNPRTGTADSSSSFSSSGNTIVTAVTPSSSSDSDDECNDDGPFFDLEFTLPDDDDDDYSDSDDRSKNQADIDMAKVVLVQESGNGDEKESSAEGEVSEDDDQNSGTAEIKFRLSSSSAGDSNNAETFSPPPETQDLLFQADSSSVLVSASSETIPKFPVSSILKSATKFRVQMLKFNKSKSDSSRLREKASKSPVQKHDREEGREDLKPNSKLLTVKLKVEEVMPLVSLLFTRDHHNSSTNSKAATNSKVNKRNGSGVDGGENIPASTTNEDEKKFAKELMNRYLKKVKPLYVRVSKRYGDKLRFSGQLSIPKSSSSSSSSSTPPPEAAEKQPAPVVEAGEEGATQEVGPVCNVSKGPKQGNNLHAGLRVVCKHLGKSRSASASALTQSTAPESSKRRDDSLLQQQDGIQSAILHCKRSFNASRDMEGSILSRSVSNSSSSTHENR